MTRRTLHTLVLVASSALTACPKSTANKTDDFAEVKATTPTASVQADKLTAAYSDNALAAETQYSGKVLQVSGKFLGSHKQTGDAGVDEWYATIDGGETGGLNVTMFVRCYFDANDAAAKTRFAALKNGDMIQMKGKVRPANAFQVDLLGCTLM
jgi:hypothetical protein